MSAIPSNRHPVLLLTFVLVLQLLLLAVQIKREQQVRLIRVWAVELATPFGRGAAWISDGIHGGWSGYVALRHLRSENADLRTERDRLKMQNDELLGRASEADRLSALLGFRESHPEVQMLAARVIGASPDSGSRIIFLSRGSHDGIKRDMGVITPEGVVGKVLAVYSDTSQVLLLSDKESGVGALLAGTRTQGPVSGTGQPLLDMQYVSNDVKVAVGEPVLTSGQDRIFPKDLPVGTVVNDTVDPHGTFQKIRVKPAARLDQLEEVLVLLTREEFTPRKEAELPSAAPASGAPAGPAADSAATPRPPASIAAAPVTANSVRAR